MQRKSKLLVIIGTLALGWLSTSGSLYAAPLKIAVIYPKDDPKVSTIGNEALCITNGVLSEAKSQGTKLDFKFFDNERDPLKTVTIAEQIAREKFDIAIGTTTSSEAIAAAKILNAAKIPFFATTATNPNVTKDKPYSFRLPFDDFHQAHTLAKFTKEELKVKRVAVVRNISIPYSEFLATEFSSQLKKINSKVIIDEFKIIEGFSTYKDLVNKILKTKPDTIFIPVYAPDVAKFYNELAATSKKQSLLGGDTVGGRKSFFKVLKGTSPNVSLVFVKSWSGNPEGPERSAFEKLHKKYCQHQDVTLISAAAYDVALATVKGLKKKTGARGLSLIKNIKNSGFNGLTGELRHNARGEPDKPLFLHKIENNRSLFWKKYP